MIEQMKKTTLVCLKDDREATMRRLGELGILHVKQVRPPASTELESLRQSLEQAERAVNVLGNYEAESGAESGKQSPDETVGEVLRLHDQQKELKEQWDHWQKVAQQLEPWGRLPREVVDRLHDEGYRVVLASASEKAFPQLPENVYCHEVSRIKGRIYFVVIATPDTAEELALEEEPFPEETDPDEVQQKLDEIQQRSREIDERLSALAAEQTTVQNHAAQLRRKLQFTEARDSMGETESLCYLQGYVPARREEKLRKAAQENGWALELEYPAEDDPDVPTWITLPRWVEPIRDVFNTLGIMPGYREIDISMWFLIFFSIFVGILIGDAGYGALFLVATLVSRKVFPGMPSRVFWLFFVMSGSVLAWGMISGHYFGLEPEALPRWDYFAEGKTGMNNVMRLCFILAVIHLTIAHAWNAVVIGLRPRMLSQLGWISILWGNYFLACKLLLDTPLSPSWFPGLTPGLYIAGISGVVLFSKPDRNPLKMVGAGVGALAMDIVDSFVDIISYIRLFAVGMATVAIEQSFNQIAMNLGLPVWIEPLPMALILLFGHGLNIMLCALAVLVHGVRLNVLEFASHMKMEWSGIQYQPITLPESELKKENENK